MPITFDATFRHYRGGYAGLMVEALQQPLLLPQDMAAYKSFNHPDLLPFPKKGLGHGKQFYSFFLHLRLLSFYNRSHFNITHTRSRNKFMWPRSG